jgi:hypothetical protein
MACGDWNAAALCGYICVKIKGVVRYRQASLGTTSMPETDDELACLACVVEFDAHKRMLKTTATDKASLVADLTEKLEVEHPTVEYFHEDVQEWLLLDDWGDFVSQKKKALRVTRVDANKPGVQLQRPCQPSPSSPSPRTRTTGAVQFGKGKTFSCFLSHHKAACAMEARFLKEKLGHLLGAQAFLDSDDLFNLTSLIDHVRDSGVLAIVQSANVLDRPWCLLELYAAIEAAVPIIAITVQGKGYDFARAADQLLHLETKLDVVNPGACALLENEGVDPLDVAFKLSTVLPSIISVKFDSSASANAINASLLDIINAIKVAKPVPIKKSRDEWLQSRFRAAGGKQQKQQQHGDAPSPASTTIAAIPLSVPELPVS